MSAFLLKFLRRLYTLFKFYSAMALLGALAVIVIGIVVEKPIVLIAALMIVCVATMMVLLLAQSHRRPQRSHEQQEMPPILPESLMIVSLPSELADDIIEDLREEFDHLRSKYGRYSAVTWYTIQSWTVFIKAVAFHCGLSFGKSLTSESRR